jgi:hypothetical protein
MFRQLMFRPEPVIPLAPIISCCFPLGLLRYPGHIAGLLLHIRANIRVHYCAEQCENDGSLSSSLLKLKMRRRAAPPQ